MLRLEGDQPGAALAREDVEQGRLPPGSRAQVDPQAVRPLERGSCERQRRQLAALVLHARRAVLDGRDRAWVAL